MNDKTIIWKEKVNSSELTHVTNIETDGQTSRDRQTSRLAIHPPDKTNRQRDTNTKQETDIHIFLVTKIQFIYFPMRMKMVKLSRRLRCPPELGCCSNRPASLNPAVCSSDVVSLFLSASSLYVGLKHKTIIMNKYQILDCAVLFIMLQTTIAIHSIVQPLHIIIFTILAVHFCSSSQHHLIFGTSN